MGVATVGNSAELPAKLKNRIIVSSRNIDLRCSPEKMKALTQKGLSAPVSVTALFGAARMWKQPCPWTDGGRGRRGVCTQGNISPPQEMKSCCV